MGSWTQGVGVVGRCSKTSRNRVGPHVCYLQVESGTFGYKNPILYKILKTCKVSNLVSKIKIML